MSVFLFIGEYTISNNIIFLLVFVIFIICGIFGATTRNTVEEREHLFSNLEVGQKVTLKEVNSGYEITIMQNVQGQGNFKIIKIQNDFVILEDIAGINEVRIPMYAIKSIKTLKLPKIK